VIFFYLPHKHGDRAQKFIEQFKFLLKTPSSHIGWQETSREFLSSCNKLMELYEKMTEISNRGILYSLYNYLWEVKEECAIIANYVQWLATDKKAPFSADAFPKIYRGGFVADLQRELLFNEDGTFSSSYSQKSNSTYVIRPCTISKEDEDAAYEVCLKTGNSGGDGTPFFNDPKVLGRRWAGPYIFLATEFSFLLEDDIGICGYVLGALDTASFYERVKKEWFSKMREIYPPNPQIIEGKRDHEVIQSFYDEDLPLPEILHPYPSHLHIDLMERAQGKHLGTKMIQLLFKKLKEKGSKGVHLQMSPKNIRAFNFYKKLGFNEILRTEDDLFLGIKF